MSDYAHKPGGSLKFKGEGDKKKKKKSHLTSEHVKATEKRELRENSNDIVETQLPALEGASVSGKRKLTEAERRFEETQRRRREERVAKMAKTTHKDRVHEFNAKLDQLSEHHDLPRIGPG